MFGREMHNAWPDSPLISMAGFVRSPSASSLALLTLLGAPSASGYTAIYSTAARRAPPPRAMAPIDPGLSTVEIERPAQFPSYRLSPEDVVEAQLAALSCGNNRRCFRFSSPEHKRATGVFHEDEDVRGAVWQLQLCLLFAAQLHRGSVVLAARLQSPMGGQERDVRQEDECLCSARVFTRMKSPAVIDVTFFCSRQPVVRPACYEDDPLQAGVSAGRRARLLAGGRRAHRRGRRRRRRRAACAAGRRWRRRRVGRAGGQRVECAGGAAWRWGRCVGALATCTFHIGGEPLRKSPTSRLISRRGWAQSSSPPFYAAPARSPRLYRPDFNRLNLRHYHP